MILVYESGLVFRTLEFDATVRELHSGTARATEHPMEQGVDLTDHVRADRARLTADVFVTNTPVRSVGTARGSFLPLVLQGQDSRIAQTAQVSGGNYVRPPVPGVPSLGAKPTVTPATRTTFPSIVSGNVLQFPVAFDRVKSVYEELEKLRASGTVVSALTDLRDYDEMVITSLSAPVTTDDAITFSLELVEIRFATSELVQVPVPREKRAKKKAPQGPKAGYELTPQQESTASAGLEQAVALLSRLTQ